MNLFQIAWQWTVLLLAEVLNASASVVETVLRSQPRWVAKVRLLEEQLRARVSGGADGPETAAADGGLVAGARSTEALLQSYAILSQALRDLEARGLALDSALMERMKREWTSESIVGYLVSSETQLREIVSKELDRAAAALGADAKSLFAGPAGAPVRPGGAGSVSAANDGRAGPGRSKGQASTGAPARRREEAVR